MTERPRSYERGAQWLAWTLAHKIPHDRAVPVFRAVRCRMLADGHPPHVVHSFAERVIAILREIGHAQARPQ
jgi:hypothetical protein